MTEVQTDWKNAPEGATHYTIKESGAIWFKNINGFWTIYDSGVWYAIGLPASDLIPRPTSTAIPEPKKLTQAVFDGLPKEYLWAAVDEDGEAYVYEIDPECQPDIGRWLRPNSRGGLVILGKGFDATDWQNSLIEREPSVAEILEAFAANPPNFDALINSVANAHTLAEAQAKIERLKVGHDRYEIVRKLNVVQFQKLYTAALKGGVSFDQVVDLYGEFFDEN